MNPYKPRSTMLRAPGIEHAPPPPPPPPPQAAAPSPLSAQPGAARSLSTGSVVLGRYTIQKVIGRGGMATVYLARNNETERLVALKILDPEISNDPSYVERFRREARAAGRIRSDHVVAIYDLGTDHSGTLVLVMEYLEGQTVQQALRTGRLPVARALTLTRQLCEGLAAAHENGVIHRDLKPANLFIERLPAGAEKLKILDFGISKLAEASSQELTRAGQTLGTLAYMAPEQIRGTVKGNDPRIDLYSAGVSIFLMLTAKRPIDADDTVQLLQAVLEKPPLSLSQAAGVEFPPALEAFVAKALSKDPTRRYQTALEMRDQLVEVMNAGSAPSPMASWGSPGDVASTVISEAPQIPAHLLPTATPPSGVIVSAPSDPGPALTLPAFEDDDDEGKTMVRAPLSAPSANDPPPVLPAAGRRVGAAPDGPPSPSPMRAPTMAPTGPGANRAQTIMGVPPPSPMGPPRNDMGPMPSAAPPPPGEATMIANPGDPALSPFGAPPPMAAPPPPTLGAAPPGAPVFGAPPGVAPNPGAVPGGSPFAPPPPPPLAPARARAPADRQGEEALRARAPARRRGRHRRRARGRRGLGRDALDPGGADRAPASATDRLRGARGDADAYLRRRPRQRPRRLNPLRPLRPLRSPRRSPGRAWPRAWSRPDPRSGADGSRSDAAGARCARGGRGRQPTPAPSAPAAAPCTRADRPRARSVRGSRRAPRGRSAPSRRRRERLRCVATTSSPRPDADAQRATPQRRDHRKCPSIAEGTHRELRRSRPAWPTIRAVRNQPLAATLGLTLALAASTAWAQPSGEDCVEERNQYRARALRPFSGVASATRRSPFFERSACAPAPRDALQRRWRPACARATAGALAQLRDLLAMTDPAPEPGLRGRARNLALQMGSATCSPRRASRTAPAPSARPACRRKSRRRRRRRSASRAA
ncbi:MAG: serine/threonine-protein kinase [Polyangiales bacterium]